MLEIIGAVIGPISSIINKLIPDPDKANELKTSIEKALIEKQGDIEKTIAEAAKAQAEINLKEAENPSMFVAGWRPFIGWVCGVAFLYAFLLQPLASWASVSLGGVVLPVLDTSTLMSLAMGMLGLGTLRTVEKVQGVDRQSLTVTTASDVAKNVVKTVVKPFTKPGFIPAPAGDRP
jgi:hypothetical protein